MKKFVLFCVAFMFISVGLNAQELKIEDGYYKSGFFLPSKGLTIDEIISAFEMNQKETGSPELVYKNEKANVFVLELSFNWVKDTVGRWWYVVIPCRCFLRGESIKVVVEDFKLEYYATMDSDSKLKRTVFEGGKDIVSEENRKRLEPAISTCRKDMESVLAKAVKYWKE